jgi:hypothetical protein
LSQITQNAASANTLPDATVGKVVEEELIKCEMFLLEPKVKNPK